MDEAQAFVEEETTIEGAGEGEASAQAPQTGVSKEEFDFLKEQNAQLMQQMSRLASQLQPKMPEKKPVFSQEEMTAVAGDAGKLADLFNSKLSQVTSELSETQKAKEYDDRMYREYPALKTDSKFQQEVLQQAKEMVGGGVPSSTVLYHAAKVVAAGRQMQGNTQAKGSTSQMPTSGDPSQSRPAPQGQKTAKISDTDPRIVAARTIGMEPKLVEELKKRLGPYTAPTRKQGRTLTRGNR